ncbi:hypothetical protein AgCh_021039 [Apium graveolens]
MVYKNFKKGIRFSIKDTLQLTAENLKAEKKQALILKKKNRDDSLESDDGVNYALMENADTEIDNVELKAPQTTLTFDTDDIYELRLFLKFVHKQLKQKLKDLHMKDKKKRSRKNGNGKCLCISGYYLCLRGDFIMNKPNYVLGIASGKLGVEQSRKRKQINKFSSEVLGVRSAWLGGRSGSWAAA